MICSKSPLNGCAGGRQLLAGDCRSDLADGSRDGEDRGSDPAGGAGTSSKLKWIGWHADSLLVLTSRADFFAFLK
jgi:hypothetical protein